MRYRTESGLVITDRRHARADDPRSWPDNANVQPPPPVGVGPTTSEGFGNEHVMYADPDLPTVYTDRIMAPPVMPWSGWPVEWSTPNWGTSVGTPELLARTSAVFGAIDMNSSILSTMPPYRLSGTQALPSLPWMINPQPEVYTGWTEAMKQVVMSYYSGEAFLWCTNRYADGTVRNWVMLNKEWVDIEMMGQMRRYFMSDVDITDDVLHLRYMSWPGYPHGLGPLAALATEIFGVEAMERYVANLATRGGIPWGVLTAPGNINGPQAMEMRTNFVNARLSAMGAPAVLGGGVTLTPFTLSPRDMALLELRQFDEARIVTLLGVPPLLMALPEGNTSMTYRNAEGIYDFHWRAFLKPKAATIAEGISIWALPTTQAIELNRDEYVKPNFAARVAGYQTMFNIVDPETGQRAMTVDEIRAAERLDSYDTPGIVTGPSSITTTAGQSTVSPPADQAAMATTGGTA
jgi:HK97 family phage portal protein